MEVARVHKGGMLGLCLPQFSREGCKLLDDEGGIFLLGCVVEISWDADYDGGIRSERIE